VKALVTGSAGFVGRHLVAELRERGWDLTTMDIADAPRRALSRTDHGDYLVEQPRDALDFFRTDTTRYDLAFHCAAVIGGRASIDGSPLSVGTNLALDAWYFRWLDRSRTPRAVYFSSSAAYPTVLQEDEYRDRYAGGARDRVRRLTLGHRLSESDISLKVMQRPDQTYGFAKLAGEFLAQYAEGTQVTIVRPFSGYGEDQALDYPFPSFIDRAKRKADPFDVWGTGEQTRDWIHIDDIVAGTLAAVEQEVPGPVNLCTGRATSFNQLAKLVCSEAGYSPAIRHLPAMPSGVHYRVGDPTKLLAFYEPKVSLEEGIRRALEA
jgi:nucleoside-diphosphate-sugar epimerase